MNIESYKKCSSTISLQGREKSVRKSSIRAHFDPAIEWWNNREEIIVDDEPKAQVFTPEQIAEGGYSFDLVGYPQAVEEILDPFELIEKYEAERKLLNQQIDDTLANIMQVLNEAKEK